jgi:hypothetical protein
MAVFTSLFPDLFTHDRNYSTADFAPITRYMRLTTFLMLLEGRLFLPTLATLRKGDPLESNIPATTYFRFETLFDPIFDPATRIWLLAKMQKWMRDYVSLNQGNAPNLTGTYYVRTWIDQLARRRCVWCWYDSTVESMAQWKIYGEAGVAVESTPGMVRDALNGKIESLTSMGKILYLPADGLDNDERLVTPPLKTRPYYVKSIAYRYEQEVRFVAEINPDNCSSDELGGFIIEAIDPAKLIKRVIISPHIYPSEATQIKSLIGKLLKGVTVEISELLDQESRTESSTFSAFQKHFDRPFEHLHEEPIGDQWQRIPAGVFDDV